MIPLRDWCIVEKYEHMHKDVRLFLPDGADEIKADDQLALRVISVGPGYWENSQYIVPDVLPGDVIITEGMNVAKFIYANKTYLAVQARYAAFRAHRDGMDKEEEVDNAGA